MSKFLIRCLNLTFGWHTTNPQKLSKILLCREKTVKIINLPETTSQVLNKLHSKFVTTRLDSSWWTSSPVRVE